MKINSLNIKNFKSIRELNITDIGNTLILVGKNNTGKTVIMDAIQLLTGDYEVDERDFNHRGEKILIDIELELLEEDLINLYKIGAVSKHKKYDYWLRDFNVKIPTYKNNKINFQFSVNKDGVKRYSDGVKKNNLHLKELLPKLYVIDDRRNLQKIHEDLFKFQGNESIENLREGICLFDKFKTCYRCFQCIGFINKKSPIDLSIQETVKLMEYKLYNLNLSNFTDRINYYMNKNGGVSTEIKYNLQFNIDELFKIQATVYNKENQRMGAVDTLGAGLRSIYILSLFEVYSEEENKIPSIILVEEPEMFLHPQLQKVASEILYRLSKKNQVIFTTHSPNMIFNFSNKQIRQIILDREYNTAIAENSSIDNILDDLGYGANDIMNVNFVFIVEGKQDSSRLPLLLEKYYSEIYDEAGNLQRIAIINTNSCTNIKTYANLKYINKFYLKDHFLMIRDSDGKNREVLKRQLCNYYEERERQDPNNLPRVTPKNVLILKYYSFENYFLNPKVMAEIGVLPNEEAFYDILYSKWNEYLYKLKSSKFMSELTGVKIESKEDLIRHIELIKTYVRGHNLFDIYYSKYRGKNENEILKKYIDVATPEDFKDILMAIDSFLYFESRKKE